MNLDSKVISFLGDSITAGVGVSDIERNRFDNILKKRLHLKAAYNYGIGGTRMAYQSSPTIVNPREDLYFCGRACELNPESDVIIVFGGTNDYGHGDAPFGALGDDTPVSFCGAVEFLMALLNKTYPQSKIVFMTPMRRNCDEQCSPDYRKALCGRPLKDYVEVIKQTAQKHDVFVIDLYNELTINPNVEADRIQYAPDGLHPNDEGHKVLAEFMIKQLKKM